MRLRTVICAYNYEGKPNPFHTIVTVSEHREYDRANQANIIPSYFPDPCQYTITLLSPHEDLVMNNMIDIVYEPAVQHRRRRLEWPRRNEAVFQSLEQRTEHSLPAPFKDFVTRLISDEFSKCGGELEQRREDHACMDELVAIPRRNNRQQNQGALLHALYYRGRQQSAIWDLYCALVDKKFLDFDGLFVPIDLTTTTTAVMRAAWLLSCFDLPNTERRISGLDPPYELWCFGFAEPTMWLATMIVRGCNDIEALFDTIPASQFLGLLDPEAYEEYLKDCNIKSFEVNPKEREGSMGKRGPFGFWLPHGLQGANVEEALDKIYPEHVMRFNRIEEAFKGYFNLSDDEILLERDQERYYERFPEKLPGHIPPVQV